MTVLGSPSLRILMASVDIKQHLKKKMKQSSKLRRCVRVEADVLGSPSLIVLMVSVDIKQHLKKKSHSVTYCRAAAAPKFGVTAVYIIMLFCVLKVCALESVFKVTVKTGLNMSVFKVTVWLRQALTCLCLK